MPTATADLVAVKGGRQWRCMVGNCRAVLPVISEAEAKKRKEEWDGLVAAMGSVEDAREAAEHEAKVAAGVLPF